MEAWITVTDAAGRSLYRRRATAAEIAQALRAADDAERSARAALTALAIERGLLPPAGGSSR